MMSTLDNLTSLITLCTQTEAFLRSSPPRACMNTHTVVLQGWFGPSGNPSIKIVLPTVRNPLPKELSGHDVMAAASFSEDVKPFHAKLHRTFNALLVSMRHAEAFKNVSNKPYLRIQIDRDGTTLHYGTSDTPLSTLPRNLKQKFELPRDWHDLQALFALFDTPIAQCPPINHEVRWYYTEEEYDHVQVRAFDCEDAMHRACINSFPTCILHGSFTVFPMMPEIMKPKVPSLFAPYPK